MKFLRTVVTACLVPFGAAALAADPNPLVTYSKKAKYEDVRDDLLQAIAARGLQR